MVLGFALNEAVGAGAVGGGGGGGGGGAFLWQAPTIMTTARVIVILLQRLHLSFNSFPLFQRESTRSS